MCDSDACSQHSAFAGFSCVIYVTTVWETILAEVVTPRVGTLLLAVFPIYLRDDEEN